MHFLAGYFLIIISINFKVKTPEKYCHPFPHPNLYKTGGEKKEKHICVPWKENQLWIVALLYETGIHNQFK